MLIKAIRQRSEDAVRPDGSLYRRIGVRAVGEIARTQATIATAVERAAVEAGVTPERYSRNFNALTADDQIRLLSAAVAVVGMGGLGGTVAEFDGSVKSPISALRVILRHCGVL
jgi:hypothetical protein